MIFTWNKNKATENIKNRSISFDETKKVFYDPTAEILLDKQHSTASEIRYKAIGFTGQHNVTVIFTVPDENREVIKIMSLDQRTNKRNLRIISY